MTGLSCLLRPHNPEPGKLTTYECGEPPTGSAWINFNIRFYLVALIFVIFDVEVAFMYPVAVVFRDWVLKGQRAASRSPRSLVFLGILFVGLVYVWVKRDLEWLKKVPVADDGRRARCARRREVRRGAERAHVADQLVSRDGAHHQGRRVPQLDAQVVGLVDALRAGLLRDRADADAGPARRRRPLRRGAARLAAAVGPDGRRRHADPEDGAAHQGALRADAGAALRHRDGGVRQLRRAVPARLLGVRRRRQGDPGRRLRARLSAAAGSADRGHPQAAREDDDGELAGAARGGEARRR